MHIVELTHGKRRIKGIGKLDAHEAFAHVACGEVATPGGDCQKTFVRMPLRLPELREGMLRRAQTISSKDAGWLVARLGLGVGDRVLEAGLGSAGLFWRGGFLLL